MTAKITSRAVFGLVLALFVSACGQSRSSPPTDKEIEALVQKWQQRTGSQIDEKGKLVFVSAVKGGSGETLNFGGLKQYSVPVIMTYRVVGNVAEYLCGGSSGAPSGPGTNDHISGGPGAYAIHQGETFSCTVNLTFQQAEEGWSPTFGDSEDLIMR